MESFVVLCGGREGGVVVKRIRHTEFTYCRQPFKSVNEEW
jgi:hypothetical protein